MMPTRKPVKRKPVVKPKPIVVEEIQKDWGDYSVQSSPHFKTPKEWLVKVKEIGNENKNRFYICVKCEGVFVNQFPRKCTCGNYIHEAFKEISGQVRQALAEGRPYRQINKFSYIQ